MWSLQDAGDGVGSVCGVVSEAGSDDEVFWPRDGATAGALAGVVDVGVALGVAEDAGGVVTGGVLLPPLGQCEDAGPECRPGVGQGIRRVPAVRATDEDFGVEEGLDRSLSTAREMSRWSRRSLNRRTP